MEIPHRKNRFLKEKNNYSPRKKSFFPTFPEIPPELPIEIEEDEEEEIEIDLPTPQIDWWVGSDIYTMKKLSYTEKIKNRQVEGVEKHKTDCEGNSHQLCKDGKILFTGSEWGCQCRLLNIQSSSIETALKYQGYQIKPITEGSDI